MKIPRAYLEPRRESSVKRRHPWIFSGAVGRYEGEPVEGELIEVRSAEGATLGVGYVGNGSIAIKMLEFETRALSEGFLANRLKLALALRRGLGFGKDPQTDSYRLVHAEGDGLPGLIIDIYRTTAVVQCHVRYWAERRQEIASALPALFGDALSCVVAKAPVQADDGERAAAEVLYGSSPSTEIIESGLTYGIDILEGQKTGFFLDQRENRSILRRYAAGRNVLNCFAYSGGFSLSALAGGARAVTSVESSKGAAALLDANVARARFGAPHTTVVEDVFSYLPKIGGAFDLIVLDPPAFVKHRKALESGLKGYESLNREALFQLPAGGILFTFSCSQLVSREDFRHLLFRAALHARREVQVLAELHAAPCHPVSIYHPEGEYLKGFVLGVV